MASSSDTIERKAINTTGRLGSFYNALRDLVVKQPYATGFENPQFQQSSECYVSHAAKTNGVIHLLKAIKFDDTLLQSILLDMVEPAGVSSLVTYNQSVNENTRFLYYLYKHREEELRRINQKVDKIVRVSSDLKGATHMITKIVWGFEVLCVIQNSDQQSTDSIEKLLYKISTQLQNCNEALKLSPDEERQIEKTSNVTVFGTQTCVDNSATSLSSILTNLRSWQRHKTSHRPITYTLHPLKCLCSNLNFPTLCRLSEQDYSYIAEIEPEIMYLYNGINHLKHTFKNLPENLVCLKGDRSTDYISERYYVLLKRCEDLQKELRQILVHVRHGTRKAIEIYNMIFDRHSSPLRTPVIDTLFNDLQEWCTKVELIKRLNGDRIIYTNAFNLFQSQPLQLTIGDIQEKVADHFSKRYSSATLWCSSDRLTREKTNDWGKTYQQLTSGRQQTRLIYVDFTECHRELEDFIVITLPTRPRSHPPQNNSKEKHPRSHSQKPPSSRTEINVLLLGETGVGKSTFINAFVNYLAFDTLHQAEQSEPVVLIPVSFLTTIGDQFDEFTVKFGDIDANEDHEHQGQSVTQQCKSYVFQLNERLTLRLIDTPGIGDTRGLAQDDRNMDHIFTYVNNLSHLNAVCLLLKPNASRLNIFFRSCISQLFTYLTPVGYNNIIFCFTNARATFFAPGDTGPLLRQMLKDEHHNEISFQKTNTFCFDSESFRYLAARKCDVSFDDFQKEECTKSWTTSVTESVRLLQRILGQQPYHLNEYQSPRKAALEIAMLARPLMETLRLIIYQLVWCESGVATDKMILSSNPVNTKIYSSCASSEIVRVGPFFSIRFEDVRSEINKGQAHQCTSGGTNFLVEYTIKYDFIAESPRTKHQLNDLLNNILLKCNRLVDFLQQQQQRISVENDPFALLLQRFINEEHHILHNVEDDTTMNRRILDLLNSIKRTSTEKRRRTEESKEIPSLDEIYQIVKELKCDDSTKKQVDTIMESRRLKMKDKEKQIKTNFAFRNEIFRKLLNSFQ